MMGCIYGGVRGDSFCVAVVEVCSFFQAFSLLICQLWFIASASIVTKGNGCSLCFSG